MMGRAFSWSRIGLLVAFCLPTFAGVKIARSVPGEYLVKVKTHYLSGFQRMNMMSTWGGQVSSVNSLEGIYKVKKSMLERMDYTLSQLSGSREIELVEPNYIYTIDREPNELNLEKLWGLVNKGQIINGRKGQEDIDIEAEKAWDITTGSHDVVVAVIDTGVDYKHEDLAENIWTNELEKNGQQGVDDDNNGYIDDIHGYDFANKDGDPMDDNNHGTHCSGTIGGVGDNGLGVVGVNWKVKIMGVKFLSGAGGGTLEDAIKSIDYAVKNKAQILSNSWGGGGQSQLLREAIERSRDAGALFVAAAGNNGSNNDVIPAYPASYDVENIVSVAAITNEGRLASFSNYGKSKVHVAAPGQDIYSSVRNNRYDSMSGTSMATPHVSGVAALIKSVNMEMTFGELKSRLIKTSRPLSSLSGKVTSKGVVSAYHALVNEEPPLDPQDPANWSSIEYSLSSPHPYPSEYVAEFTVHVPGVEKMALYFSKFVLEDRYDKVIIEDTSGNTLAVLTGTQDDSFSPVLNTDTVILKMTSDKSVQRYGFDITKIAIQMKKSNPLPPVDPPPSEEPPKEENPNPPTNSIPQNP